MELTSQFTQRGYHGAWWGIILGGTSITGNEFISDFDIHGRRRIVPTTIAPGVDHPEIFQQLLTIIRSSQCALFTYHDIGSDCGNTYSLTNHYHVWIRVVGGKQYYETDEWGQFTRILVAAAGNNAVVVNQTAQGYNNLLPLMVSHCAHIRFMYDFERYFREFVVRDEEHHRYMFTNNESIRQLLIERGHIQPRKLANQLIGSDNIIEYYPGTATPINSKDRPTYSKLLELRKPIITETKQPGHWSDCLNSVGYCDSCELPGCEHHRLLLYVYNHPDGVEFDEDIRGAIDRAKLISSRKYYRLCIQLRYCPCCESRICDHIPRTTNSINCVD